MNVETARKIRSKMLVNLGVYVWAFAALLAAPMLDIPPFAAHLIFYVFLGAGLAVAGWPVYGALKYKTA